MSITSPAIRRRPSTRLPGDHSLAIQVDNQEQQALILLSMGISYRLLNKPEEALRNYQESIAVNEKIGQKRGVAAALNEMAAVQTDELANRMLRWPAITRR